jgi:hypothetical protein
MKDEYRLVNRIGQSTTQNQFTPTVCCVGKAKVLLAVGPSSRDIVVNHVIEQNVIVHNFPFPLVVTIPELKIAGQAGMVFHFVSVEIGVCVRYFMKSANYNQFLPGASQFTAKIF